MMYSKEEMRQLLIDAAFVSPDAIDIAIKLVGDNNETYKKILNIATPYSTFFQLEDAWNEEIEQEMIDSENDIEED